MPEDLKKQILRCVDAGMNPLGESARQSVYYHIEKVFKVRREEIPDKPKEFIDSLRKIFGPGAETIETAIVREMEATMNLNLEDEGFVKAVEQAKKSRGLIHGSRQ
jgi:hypothetical protein